MKDRAAKHIIEGIIHKNNLKVKKDGNGHRIAERYSIYEGTSGNTGISLGLLSNFYGLEAKIYLNDDLADEKVNLKSFSINP